jgi:hypothetical protein
MKDKVELFRPTKLEIVDTNNGGFKIVYKELDGRIDATFMEFNPNNSDLGTEQAREFAEWVIGYYNHNYS